MDYPTFLGEFLDGEATQLQEYDNKILRVTTTYDGNECFLHTLTKCYKVNNEMVNIVTRNIFSKEFEDIKHIYGLTGIMEYLLQLPVSVEGFKEGLDILVSQLSDVPQLDLTEIAEYLFENLTEHEQLFYVSVGLVVDGASKLERLLEEECYDVEHGFIFKSYMVKDAIALFNKEEGNADSIYGYYLDSLYHENKGHLVQYNLTKYDELLVTTIQPVTVVD